MIVGLSGYARSGKDTAAQALIEQGFRRDAFADRLRSFLYELDPIVDFDHYDVEGKSYTNDLRLRELVDQVGWERAKNESDEVRYLLMRCGTEAGRKVLGKSVWVNALFQGVKLGDNIVITDCRFENEADGIRARGGIVVRVERPGVGPKLDSTGKAHVSEVALDHYGFDYVIENDGDIAQLQEDVRCIVHYLCK